MAGFSPSSYGILAWVIMGNTVDYDVVLNGQTCAAWQL